MHYARRVLCLCLEATNPAVPGAGLLVAEVVAGAPRVLAEAPLGSQGRHDDALMPAVERLLRAAHADRRAIGEVLVSIGPGGFTATRLACVTAAMLAECLDAALLACPTAWVAAACARRPAPHPADQADPANPAPPSCPPLVVALASKGQAAYLARFPADAPIWQADGATTDADGLRALALSGDRLVCDGALPQPLAHAADAMGLQRLPLVLDARGLLACRPFARRADPALIRPIYPREPDAVTQWRARHGRAPGDA